VVVDGLRVHCLDWGGDERPPLVFLHGGALTAHTWDVVSLGLRDRYRCVAPDLRGHGESEWPATRDYRLEAYADDVLGLIRELGLGRVCLIGNSLGGQVALVAAAARPELVQALVLVDVGDDPAPPGAADVRAFIAGPAEFATLDAAVDHALAFNPRRKPHILRRSLRNNLRELATGGWRWKYDARAFATHDDEPAMRHRRSVLEDAVGRAACPVLIVRGGDSRVFLREDAEDLTARFADGRWAEVADAGHTIQGDNPGGLLERLEPFLRERVT
jgi:pimeloyl-ACP methyl ester carboxylesterase